MIKNSKFQIPNSKLQIANCKFDLKILTVFIIVTAFLLTVPQQVQASYDYIPQVRVYSHDGQQLKSTFLAYHKEFRGGLKIAAGDINGDGRDEIITGAGPGGGPHVRVFDIKGNLMWENFVFDQNFLGGVDVAAGDVNGDGKDEIIVSQLSRGQAWIKVYEADIKKTILAKFLAFRSDFEGGCHIASGDVDGDGKDEIIAGAGSGGGPHVRVFDTKGKLKMNFWPFHKNFRGGVDVASGDIDKDGQDEIIMAQNSFGQAWVKVYRYDKKRTVISYFMAYASDFRGGTNISAGDLDGDGRAEIITGANMGGRPHVKVFKFTGRPKGISFFAYPLDFSGGVNVAIGNLQRDSTNEIITSPGKRLPEGRVDLYKYIEVDLSSQTLKYYERGYKIDEFYISSGTWRRPTPTGEFKVLAKILRTRMRWYYGPSHPDNYDYPNVPHVLVFHGHYTLHGAYWHRDFGRRRSHGCVNLPLRKAAELYRWAEIGTPVIIHE